MSRLNDPENFRGRVAYAAKVIAYGRRPTRAFDNCFENYDGDEVATAILRRSRTNTRLAANLHRYLNLASTEAAAERLADISTRKLPQAARQSRARGKAEFDALFDERHLTDTVAGSDTADVKTRSMS
ncbi:hypothetical protein NKH45_30235 [Mesorhizobium sp. M1156]|uniref:hypothetical protein n=1 Tax=Mesorhizobium sp. M1156 TaxID=2957064 RepID=UPI0033385401